MKVEPVGEFELKGIRRPLAPHNEFRAWLNLFGDFHPMIEQALEKAEGCLLPRRRTVPPR